MLKMLVEVLRFFLTNKSFENIKETLVNNRMIGCSKTIGRPQLWIKTVEKCQLF